MAKILQTIVSVLGFILKLKTIIFKRGGDAQALASGQLSWSHSGWTAIELRVKENFVRISEFIIYQ